MSFDSSTLNPNSSPEELCQAAYELKVEFEQCLQRCKHEGVFDTISMINLISRQIALGEIVALKSQTALALRTDTLSASYSEVVASHERTVQILDQIATTVEHLKTISFNLVAAIEQLQTFNKVHTKRHKRVLTFLFVQFILVAIYGVILASTILLPRFILP